MWYINRISDIYIYIYINLAFDIYSKTSLTDHLYRSTTPGYRSLFGGSQMIPKPTTSLNGPFKVGPIARRFTVHILEIDMRRTFAESSDKILQCVSQKYMCVYSHDKILECITQRKLFLCTLNCCRQSRIFIPLLCVQSVASVLCTHVCARTGRYVCPCSSLFANCTRYTTV